MFERIAQRIFLISFFSLIIVPLIFMNHKEGAISITENRVLAPTAKLYLKNGQINKNYFKDIEKWFNDNIGFRETLVALDAKIQYCIFNRINQMPLGEHGELAPYESIDDLQHRNLFTTDEINKLTTSYQVMANYLHSLGIQVFYMQCWDKNTIYPEQYPSTIKIQSAFSKADQIENSLKNNTDIIVIPIKEKLISEKKNYSVYGEWAEPWHWTQRGAYIGYQQLIAAINKFNNGKYRVLNEADFNIEKVDQGQTFFGSIHKQEVLENFAIKAPKAVKKDEMLTYFPDVRDVHYGYYINNAVDNNDTLLILGDSYLHDWGILPNLAESFHTTVMFNGTSAKENQFIHIINSYHPNIVVFENAERCIWRCLDTPSIASSLKNYLYSSGEKIRFYSTARTSEKYIIKGFHDPDKEDGFTWTKGDSSILYLYMPEINVGKVMTGTFKIDRVINNVQQVRIKVNGVEVKNCTIKNMEDIVFQFIMPKSNMITIEL